MEKLPLSIVFITFNEEKNLKRTLDAVCSFASEIIVVDSFSTDNTVEIAESYGANVYQEKWKGYIDQKNSAMNKCTKEWLLSLDADEVPSEELIQSIRVAIKDPEYDGYYINRKTIYLGKMMNHAWQPDWKLRLVKSKSDPIWRGQDLHERLEISGSTSKLKGELFHYSYNGLAHHFTKAMSYAQISAEAYYKNNRHFSPLNLILNPAFAFFRLYILRKGFLDGIHGFIAAASSFWGTFLKYAFLWEKELKQKRQL
jgi:glycosyltransferase involved in cell wall biosynthesis